MELWEKNEKMRTELVSFVDQFEFQMWFTGTFKPNRSYRDTIKTKKAFGKFIGDLRNNFHKEHIEFFLAVERFKHGDFTHVHALINGVEGLTYNQVSETWRDRFGRCRTEGYQKDKGVAFYLTKYILKDLCDWDLHIDKRKSHKLIF